MTMKSTPRAAILAVLTALPLYAAAHDLVLVPDVEGTLTIRFGHPGDWQTTDKSRLLDLQTLGATGAAAPLTAPLKPSGLNLIAPAPEAGSARLASARYDNGLWVTVPDAAGKPVFYNTSKAMLPRAITSMSAVKFAKGLFGSADDAGAYKREVGHLIEIIPQRNPATLKVGEKLTVLVKFNGKPLAKAGVELTDSATTAVEGQTKIGTDAAGLAQVPIARAGVNVVSVDYERANDGSMGKAVKALPVDKVVMIATYAFQVR
jgi:nickel transport protein